LSSVSVDVDRRVALVEPAATHRDMAERVVPHGLAFPIGHCPSVGLGGYLLAGGFGWNPGAWGPGCWSVTAVEVITADGEHVIADADNHPELFWAARGAGPGFPGVVTRFHLRLQELPKILGHRAPYRLGALPELARWAADTMQRHAGGVEISLIARSHAADGEPRVMLSATSFAATIEDAATLLDILDDAPCESLRIDGPYREEIGMTDLEGEGGWVEGLRYAVDGCQYELDAVAAVAARVKQDVRAAPSRLSRIVLVFTSIPAEGPDVALTRLGDADVSSYATWEDPSEDAANVTWLSEHIAGLRPWTVGFYSGESDLLAEPDRPQRCFTPENWQRLRAVKATYDPDNRFFDYLGPEL
jgi:FAD/FMN-containing dehydrogenase